MILRVPNFAEVELISQEVVAACGSLALDDARDSEVLKLLLSRILWRHQQHLISGAEPLSTQDVRDLAVMSADDIDLLKG